MNEELLKEVLSDEEYVKSLLQMEEPEEVVESLKAKGVEITVEELIQTKDILEKHSNGELSDDDLDEVAGGCVAVVATAATTIITQIAIAAGVGGAIAGAGAAVVSVLTRW